jgi:Homeodomain-like domain
MTFELMLPVLLICLACQIKPQGDNEAGASQVLIDRILHGTKEIAEYMGVSAGTISRWRTRYRGREEFLLCFPAILTPTGKGWGFRMISSTVLIRQWMERWWQIDAAAAQEKAKRKRKPPKVKRLGETNKPSGALIERKRPESTREEPSAKVETRPEPPKVELPPSLVNQEPTSASRPPENVIPEGCTCGSPTITCTAH